MVSTRWQRQEDVQLVNKGFETGVIVGTVEIAEEAVGSLRAAVSFPAFELD